MVTNKYAAALSLLLVVVFNLVGIAKIGVDNSILWVIVDSYNIIIFTIFADEFFRERLVVLHSRAMGLLAGISVLSIFSGYFVATDKYWHFIDIFIITIAALLAVKILAIKSK